jgi:hypothetical protein
LTYNSFGGTSGVVYSLAFDSTKNVYAGGSFGNAGGVGAPVNNIAKWDVSASRWSALTYNGNSGTNGQVNSLAFDSTNNVLYAGGNFTSAGGVTVNKIAKWTISATPTWSALGSDPVVNGLQFVTIAIFNDIVYYSNQLNYQNYIYKLNKYNNVSTCYYSLFNNNNLYYYNS